MPNDMGGPRGPIHEAVDRICAVLGAGSGLGDLPSDDTLQQVLRVNYADRVWVTEDNITARAGGGQPAATPLAAWATFHNITTVLLSGDSVLLPPAIDGSLHIVRNTGTVPVQAYGNDTDLINAQGYWPIPPRFTMVFVCVTSGRWYALDPVVWVPSALAAQVVSPSDTAENALWTCTFPAGCAGNRGTYEVDFTIAAVNNANVKTINVRHSGAAGTIIGSVDMANNAFLHGTVAVSGRGTSTSQIGHLCWRTASGAGASAPVATAVVWGAPSTIVISATKATGSDSLTGERMLSKILYSK